MIYVDVKTGVLTSDGSGDATKNVGSSIGKIYKIEVQNSAASKPSDNWDLTIYSGTIGSPDYEEFFKDITISQGVTAKIVYYPRKKVDLQDGTASTLTEEPCMIFNRDLKLIGANMGDTKVATVKVFLVK